MLNQKSQNQKINISSKEKNNIISSSKNLNKKKSIKHYLSSSSGFTLIELLAVITILMLTLFLLIEVFIQSTDIKDQKNIKDSNSSTTVHVE